MRAMTPFSSGSASGDAEIRLNNPQLILTPLPNAHSDQLLLQHCPLAGALALAVRKKAPRFDNMWYNTRKCAKNNQLLNATIASEDVDSSLD